MGIALERGNMTSVGAVASQLVKDMIANGFTLLNLNGVAGSAGVVDATMTKALLAPTTAVDPLAIEDTATTHADYAKRQPWRFAIEVDHTVQGIRWFFCTPTNILTTASDFTVSISSHTPSGTAQGAADKIARSGMLMTGSLVQSDATATPQWDKRTKPSAIDASNFYSKDKFSFSYSHFAYDISKIDRQSIPLSYRLAISDHGIAFCLWVETRDSAGDRFTWFNTQRMVDKETGEPIVDGKAPLFCVFSMNGGGGSNVNVADEEAVYYFVVREADVNSPSFPVSASVDSADSNRIINVVQQVSISENNHLILSMMKGMNTQRYSYPHELDMIAYVSADVVSQYQDVEITQYGEAEKRSFKALKANFANNTGMRILMLQKGAGIA